jgi:multidrug transporter EmrE-like cation transporter
MFRPDQKLSPLPPVPISIHERVPAIYYAALYASIGFGVAGQLLMKWAALGTVGSASAWTSLPNLIVALGVYSLGVLNWIFALRGVRLSVAYSLSSLNYVGILFGSYYWFGEQIGGMRIVGVLLIFTGVVLVVLRAPRRG